MYFDEKKSQMATETVEILDFFVEISYDIPGYMDTPAFKIPDNRLFVSNLPEYHCVSCTMNICTVQYHNIQNGSNTKIAQSRARANGLFQMFSTFP